MDEERRRYRAACPREIKDAVQAAIGTAFEEGRYGVKEMAEASDRAFKLGRKKPIQPKRVYADRDLAYCLVGKMALDLEAALKTIAAIASTVTDDRQFRLGHRVPRHVYRGDEPLFTAATEELARELVDLLNLGLHGHRGDSVKNQRLQ